MTARIFVEGGAREDNRLDVLCRQGFRALLERSGFKGRLPRIVACGSRAKVYDSFATAHSTKPGTYVALWVDSEGPLANLEAAWAHLEARDHWNQPPGARDDQVLFMTTCMETWIVADRATLDDHYGSNLQQNALPPLDNLENRTRHDIQERLAHATRNCTNAYEKGKRAFIILGLLNPTTLEKLLPSFARARRILNARL